MSPAPTRRAGRNRHDILRAANDVMAERGFELTRFADVAKSSGTSVSTLQYLFGNREDLLIASLRQRADDFLTSVRAVAETHDDPVDRLRSVVGEMLSVGYPLDEARRDWAVWIEYWRAASRDPELGVEAQLTYQSWFDLLAEAVTASGAPIDRVRDLTSAAIAMIDGFGIQLVLGYGQLDREHAASTVLATLA